MATASASSEASALLLRRRVVSVADFAAELRSGHRPSASERVRRFGSAVLPVPVPLAPGESEAQYEARFVAWLAARDVALPDLASDANRERSFRMSFAERVARDYRPSSYGPSSPKGHKRDEYMTSDGRIMPDKVPRELTLIHEYMSLEDFQKDSRRGRFVRIGRLDYEEKQRTFGSPYAPIFVPLAPGETVELYEKRFVRWLETKRGMTLREVQTHKLRIQERCMRMQFAALNAKGQERFVPPKSPQKERKRERVASEEERHNDSTSPPPTTKKLKEEATNSRPEAVSAGFKKPEEGETCPGQDSVDACRACGCRRCLLNAIRFLAVAIFTLEGKASKRHCSCRGQLEPTEVADLTIPTGKSHINQQAGGESSTEETGTDDEDSIEQQLLDDYEMQNELIVMNENVLDESAVGFAELVASDFAEATRRREEEEEMREMLEEEMDKRSAALAVLLVYMYRHDVGVLEKMIESPQASDITHVQRLSHHKCMRLATEIAETQAQLDQDAEPGVNRRELREKLKRLKEQRRRELVTIVYFEQRVRELIRGWLARIESPERNQQG